MVSMDEDGDTEANYTVVALKTNHEDGSKHLRVVGVFNPDVQGTPVCLIYFIAPMALLLH